MESSDKNPYIYGQLVLFKMSRQSNREKTAFSTNGGFPGGSEVEASACNVGDLGSIPGSGRFPREGNGNPLQYSCLENPMDGGAWWATATGWGDFTFTFTFNKW